MPLPKDDPDPRFCLLVGKPTFFLKSVPKKHLVSWTSSDEVGHGQ